jgi:VCBS repeat-containing protein
MKKIILFSAAVLLGLAACNERLEEITDPTYARLFSPNNLEAEVQGVVNVTLKWDEVQHAQGYVLELTNTVTSVTTDTTTGETTLRYENLAENVEYSVRIQAVSDKIPASKWTVATFTTTPPPPPETTEWNFSDEAFADIPDANNGAVNITVNGLKVIAGGSNIRRTTITPIEIDDYTFTHRLDLGGAGTWSSNPEECKRMIYFKANRPCVITVYAHSATAGRTLKITNGSETVLAEYQTTGSTPGKVSFNCTESSDIFIYSAGSGIDVHMVKMVVGGVSIPLDATTDLKGLAVTGETLTPAFDPEKTLYEVTVPKSAAEVEITFDKGHPGQIVAGAGKQAFTAKDSVEFPVKVTSEDSVNERIYTVKVKRNQTASADADLKTLTVSAGTLSPAFSASTTDYTLAVGNSVGSITVTGTANHKFATVGNIGKELALQVGDNKISVVVLAEDLSVKTYSITVTRAAVSTDATLKNLTVSGEGLLVPAFSPTVYSYTDTVLHEVSSVTVTGTANHEAATVSDPVTVELQDGDNTLATITVTAEDGTTQDYTVKVVRKAEGETITEPGEPPVSVIKEWNFSDDEFSSITTDDYKTTETVRDLDVVGGSGGVRRTSATEEMDGYTFTWKLDLRGSGTWNSDLAQGNRLIHFKVEEACTLTVYAKSTTADRTLKITDKNNTTLGTYITTGTLGKVEVNVTEANDIFIYSGGSGIEVYLVKVVY